jgi:hypothetical protein
MFMGEMNMHPTKTWELWCWNDECPNYGKTGEGNIVFKEAYGNNQNSYSNAVPVGTASAKHVAHPFLNLKHPKKRSYELWQCFSKREVFAVSPERQVIPKIR